jgi:hypothetical protein
MKAVELLAQAQQILSTRASGGLSSRMAAFLARRALEEVIELRCTDLAASAWNRLSNACHLHAYEMQPSIAEVEQLCGVVAGLLPAGPSNS